MTSVASATPAAGRPASLPLQLAGGWEVGILVFMAALYGVGVFINPGFFGSTDAISSVLRDTARYGVMAVGMTFVIVNKELDLSVGSILGLVATVFSILYAPSHLDLGAGWATFGAVLTGLTIGLINGVLVTRLKVPAFIATLTMLFIGRGFVLGLTGGKTVAYERKAAADGWFFGWGETNAFGFNSQILIFAVVALLGALALAKTRMGFETYAVGDNEQAASYAGIPTRWVRMRAYLLSALGATLAGLMIVAQDKGITSQYGGGAELVVIAAVIVGGASIAGGRGRVVGACLGAALVVLIDKVLREGIPITREIDVGGIKMEVQAYAQLPPGAVPAFLGLILLGAVLIEPWAIKGGGAARVWALLRRRAAPPAADRGEAAIVGAQTRGAGSDARGVGATGLRAFLARRDAAAILLTVGLWLVGLWLRPDFWGSLDNSFNLLLAFTEIALVSVGLTFVLANADVDLSVGSVLALSGAIAAFLMKELGADPAVAVLCALAGGTLCGVVNGLLTVRFGLPAFVATLGTFYIARGLGAWLVAGRQLSGFSESFNLMGRNLFEVLAWAGAAPSSGLMLAVAKAVSVQTIFLGVVALVAGVVLARTVWGQMIYAVGGNERAARYAGIDTRAVRFWSLVFSALCASAAGVIYVAYYRSFNPSAGQLRELDGIAAVIIGGGSIFGGFGSVLGSLAGAAAITLIRSLLSLQLILADGSSFVMPQHWMNVFIGLVLIGAVVGDIWIRQENILARLVRRRSGVS
ncbi:sugar ABC transporter permease [Alsobacter metallidurans]|uniref:Sugar ABC transporter permease n=1 Tax=Alsobacter metallidurans TaxID=340221 RepID=A0A917MG29_9HYPH|nr:ABC transporter permease [Alsobacter metallidurans]GGH08263.1 sugar ABC transporter permease [Alsobacter metallidurans]